MSKAEYLDFAGGIAVPEHRSFTFKHCFSGRSAVEETVPYLFSGAGLANRVSGVLCERMNQVPGVSPKTLLVTTGSEAVENAAKMPARQQNAAALSRLAARYHGRTHYTPSDREKYTRNLPAGMGLMP